MPAVKRAKKKNTNTAKKPANKKAGASKSSARKAPSTSATPKGSRPRPKATAKKRAQKASRVLEVRVTLLPHSAGIPLPTYETKNSAGMDLRAALGENESITLEKGQSTLVPTGLTMALPDGYEAQVRPRSGLALKHGITCLNTPGTIDADYRGEVKVLLINLGQEAFTIRRGERIAQMVVAPVTQAAWQVVDALPNTARGEGGFGSTGRK